MCQPDSYTEITHWNRVSFLLSLSSKGLNTSTASETAGTNWANELYSRSCRGVLMARRICEDHKAERTAEQLYWVRFLQGYTLPEIVIAYHRHVIWRRWRGRRLIDELAFVCRKFCTQHFFSCGIIMVSNNSPVSLLVLKTHRYWNF